MLPHMTTTATYVVKGMTCGHCVNAVTQAVSELGGVQDVNVDLASGRVTVSSSSPLDRDTVIAAIDDAGFESE